LLSGCSKRPAPEPTKAPKKIIRGKGTVGGLKSLPTGVPVVGRAASAAPAAPSTGPAVSRAAESRAATEDATPEASQETMREETVEEPIVTVSPHTRYDADLALQIENDLMDEWARVEEELDDICAIEMIANIKAFFEGRRMKDDEHMARLLFERDLLAEWNRLHEELKKADASPAELIDELAALFADRRAEMEKMALGNLSTEVEESLAAEWNEKVDLVYGLDKMDDEEEHDDVIKDIRFRDEESRLDTLSDDDVVDRALRPRTDSQTSTNSLEWDFSNDLLTFDICFEMMARGGPMNAQRAECQEIVDGAIATDPEGFVGNWTMYMTDTRGELATNPMTKEYCRRIVHIPDAHTISVNFIRSLYQERRLTKELRLMWGQVFDAQEAARFAVNNLNFCRQQV
jgi:hypothetical protein